FARPGVADRSRIRIRQRLSRHRQCGRDRHLHSRLAGPCRGPLVGHVEPYWRARFECAVAFSIVSLLPVELILQVGSGAGYALVFALLSVAVLGTPGAWWLGIPASSSHTLIGSIVGVGVANALMRGKDGTSGVDWDQVTKVGEALLFSPIFGFFLAALLLLAMKAVIRVPALYKAPTTNAPPPLWIRGLLILTCTLVSFFHGSNDGQNGMGLIMLNLWPGRGG